MDYWTQSKDLTNSFLLVVPLLVLYEVGLLLNGFRGLNGVDFVTVAIIRYGGMRWLVIFNLALIAAAALVAAWRRKDERFEPAIIVPTCAESLIYAFLLGGAIVSLMRLLHVDPTLQVATGGPTILDRLIISIGAGVNEEIFFRLGLFGALHAIARRSLGRGEALSFVAAAALSSVAFSLAHFSAASQASLFAFVYRLLAGVIFCIIYRYRSFAVGVYTHAFYDILVLLFR